MQTKLFSDIYHDFHVVHKINLEVQTYYIDLIICIIVRIITIRTALTQAFLFQQESDEV